MMKLLLLIFICPIVHCACPDDFKLYADGQCVQLTPTKRSSGRNDQDVTNAIRDCKENQTQPVIIHYGEQQSYWTDQYEATHTFVILGIVCSPTSSNWQWSDGSPIDYKPAGLYNSSALDAPCSSSLGSWYLTSDGYWDCDNGFYRINYNVYCTAQLPPPIYSDESCKSLDDESNEGICYQIGNTVKNWQSAQTACRKYGGDLVSIHSLTENSFVRRLAVSKGALNGLFLGATKSGKGDQFGWIDGTEWNFDYFYPGFPLDGQGDCVAMDTLGQTGEWLNKDCSANLAFACTRQQPRPKPVCQPGPMKEGEIITSPGFPLDASTPCEFILTVAAGKKVQVEILLLEANGCCDRLILTDDFIGGNIIANLTGEVSDQTYTTPSSNLMRVSWQPNGGVNVRGMMMTFRGV